MLQSLTIKNIAVIDAAEIPFKPGLNILSGETGAGKSIVIEAISLLLGSRANTELVRAGCDEALVQGLFDISEIPWIKPRMEKLGLETTSDELLVRRTIARSGRHRIHINGEATTLAILENLCEGLVDLCGQHEHQSLVRTPRQLELLDRYGGLTDQSRNVAATFVRVRELEKTRNELQDSEVERAKRADFLSFQVEELRNAKLEPDEDELLQKEKQLLQSAEARAKLADQTRDALEAEEGVLSQLRTAQVRLRSLVQMDDSAMGFLEGLERAIAEAEDVAVSLNRYLTSAELDPERLTQVQERLSLIADLRRKYGATVADMLATLERLEGEFSSLGQVGQKLGQLTAELEQAQEKLLKDGKKLSSARKKIAAALADSVTGELKDLKMGEAIFDIQISSRGENLAEWTASGADEIQFVVQTNRGEPARPLGKVASGGELSRLMLAIRRVISDRGGIGVYLFDEIDAGIGGQTAFQVGKKLRSVAAYNQVICITHLPQVASFADHHLVVRKTSSGKRTITEVAELTAKERKEELARMLGGPELTRKSLDNAAELLELAGR
jgi:DNA repair protein RecN (Recombination protein N)